MSRRRAPPEPPRADWRSMLAARPVRNLAAKTEPAPDGGLWIIVRTAPAPWRRAPWKWIVPGRDRRRVALDRLGQEAWGLCDGQRSVEEIVEEMSRRYCLSFHEARAAVTAFIRELVQRGALAIALPPDPEGAEAEAQDASAR